MSANGVRLASAKPVSSLAIIATAVLIVVSGYFAPIQNVWIDESTQLLGSRLPLGRMLRWLAGGYEPLGVPGDRMPPASYLIDWACGRTVCAGVLGFRLVHLLAAATGVFLTARLAAKRHGTVAGLVTGLLLALLPQTTLVAVEIRAYPWFFALTALQLVLLYGLFDTPELVPRRLVIFAVLCVLSTYTHFFGLVSSSALFAGLAVARVRKRREALLVGGAWAALLVCALGLAPFIDGARSISDAQQVTAVTPGAVVAYLSRIVGSAPMLLMPALAAAFFACFGLLLAAAALLTGRTALRTSISQPLEPSAAVLVAAVAGLVVTILAAVVVHGFDPMKPSYSVWLLPPLALLAGYACAQRRLLAAVGGAMLVALLPITGGFLVHAGLFVHGPSKAIAGQVGDHPRGTAMVYTSVDWAYAYFPLVYRYGGALDQYVRDRTGRLHRIALGGNPNTPVLAPAALDGYARVLLASVATRTGTNLRRTLLGEADPALSTPLPATLLGAQAAHWRETGAIVRPGLYWLQLTALERRP